MHETEASRKNGRTRYVTAAGLVVVAMVLLAFTNRRATTVAPESEALIKGRGLGPVRELSPGTLTHALEQSQALSETRFAGTWTALGPQPQLNGQSIGSEASAGRPLESRPAGTAQADYNLALGGDLIDPSTVFLGLVGLYKSSDGGSSWKYVISDAHGLHSDFHTAVVNNSIVWVTNDGGVSLSTDGGTTCDTSVNNGLNTMQFQGAAISKTGSAIIGGTQDNGSMVYNGTLAWQHATDGDGGITAVAQSDPSIVFTELQFEQKECLEHLFRSRNGGRIGTFDDITPVGAGKQPGQFLTPISLDPSNDDRLLYGTTLIWDTCGPTGKACNATSGNPLNWSDINPQSGAPIKCNNCNLSDVRVASTDPGVMYAITDLGTIGAKTRPQAFVSTDSNTANLPSPTSAPVWVRLLA